MLTGVDEPMFVAGAIAAMWLAYIRYVPALAARDAVRRDVGRDRYLRREDRLDHVAHRMIEAAGRIELQHEQRGIGALCAFCRFDTK